MEWFPLLNETNSSIYVRDSTSSLMCLHSHDPSGKIHINCSCIQYCMKTQRSLVGIFLSTVLSLLLTVTTRRRMFSQISDVHDS